MNHVKGGTLSVKEVLLKTLEDLGDEDFKTFKWFLRDILGGLPVIPKSQLEKADRLDTVDKIIQTYNQQSVEVVKKILKKVNRADLVESLSSSFRTGERGHPLFGFHATEEGLKKFTVEVDEVYKDKQPIDGGMWWLVFYQGAVCCTVCEENCHYPGCTMASYPGQCVVMKDGHCTVCSRKCPVSAHMKEEWIYVTKTRKVQKTLEEVKEYEKNKRESESRLSLLENLEMKMEDHQKDKDQWSEESFQHVVKTENIPLNVDSVSNHVYLIEKMHGKGVTEKVQKLEEMKSQEDKGVLVAPRKNNTSRPHDNITCKELIQSGSPAVYQLKPKKEKIGTLRRMTLGEKDVNKTNRTILLVGETGAGKSTLFNALVNYTMGVKWEDNVWFQIVEEEKRSLSESQTSDVIVYEIFGFEDKTLPYSLTIINTPGYGDTRGTKEDEAVKHRLFDLFRSEDGVHEINAVGLVLKATENRVSYQLRYIFDSVMFLFGKDMEKNIVALITHSDGLTYENALKALEDGNIKCAKNEENELVYFLFNNHQNKQRTKRNEAALNSAWRLTMDGMSQFTDFLKETEPQKMMSTVEVLNSQITETVEFIELKQKEIQQTQEALKKNEKDETASLSGNLKKETKELQKDKDQWLEESFQHVVKLEQIALNADSLSTLVHLDFLIEKMKVKGDTEKVQKLEEMKRRVDEDKRVLPALGYECSKLTAAGKEVIQLTSDQKTRFPEEEEEDSADSKEKPPLFRNSSYKYNDIISKSALIQSGSPAVYQLKPKKEKIGTLTRMTLGEKDLYKTNRTILLVGETGTGKSTLINTLVNYTMGVKWEDDVWFQIVEEEKRSQSESQTSDVIVYEIFGFEGKTLPYSLTIIDTPGYGNTRGTEQDDIISQRLLDLFRSEDGVHEINAVGLVLKATENRLCDRLRYIFDSVMSLFGKNIEKNIVALITHSDGTTHKNVLKTLEDAKIKFAKDEKNQSVCFLFDNCQHEDRTEDTEYRKYADKISTKGLRQFTDFLEKIEPENLKTTVDVLNSRIRLTACIQNLQHRVEFIELKQKEIQQTEEGLKKYEQGMKNNEKFTVEVDEVYKDKQPIDGGRWGLVFYGGAVCCTVCEENCHYPCKMGWSPEHCEYMKDGHCTVCTRKCPVSAHVKEKWIYVTKTRKLKKTLEEVKEKYEKNKTERESRLSLLENLKKKTEELQKDKDRWLEESFQHVVRLEQIALNTDSVSTLVHLDFLIEKMKEKGDTEKVQKLEEMKRRVDKDKGVRAALRYGFIKLTTAGKC